MFPPIESKDIIFRRRSLMAWFIGILLVLNVGNAVSVYVLCVLKKDFAFGIVPLFNFDKEGNFPTLFNGLLLVFGCLLALAISRCLRLEGGPPFAASWKAVGLVMGFLALDELCHIHESIGWILMPRMQTDGAVSWPWILPYAALALAVIGFFTRFFFRLEPRYRVYFAVAGGLYILAAIGLEMAEAKHVEGVIEAGQTRTHGKDSLTYGILYTIEENLEMIAVMIANCGFIAYAVEHCRGLRLGIRVSL